MHWMRSAVVNFAQSFSISLSALFSLASQLATVLPELPDRSMAALHVLETSKRGIASATLITRFVPANSIAKVTISGPPIKLPLAPLRDYRNTPGRVMQRDNALLIVAKQRLAEATYWQVEACLFHSACGQ